MPHYTCANCRIRLRTSGAPAELAGDLCPRCGSLLQPAADLEGLIGFQSIDRLDEPDGAVRTSPHQRLLDCLDEFSARRVEEPGHEPGALDAEPWDDDPIAVSVALPVVQRYR